MQNVIMLAMQSVHRELLVLEIVMFILNVVPLVHKHGLVKQMSLDQMNNAEVCYDKTCNIKDYLFFLGEGYVGIKRCAEGLRCYARSKWYSHCAASCPGVEWAC